MSNHLDQNGLPIFDYNNYGTNQQNSDDDDVVFMGESKNKSHPNIITLSDEESDNNNDDDVKILGDIEPSEWKGNNKRNQRKNINPNTEYKGFVCEWYQNCNSGYIKPLNGSINEPIFITLSNFKNCKECYLGMKLIFNIEIKNNDLWAINVSINDKILFNDGKLIKYLQSNQCQFNKQLKQNIAYLFQSLVVYFFI